MFQKPIYPAIARPTGSENAGLQNLGGVIRRPNSGRFDADHAHAEHDQSTFIGNSQIEVGRIPELLSDIGQELARVFHGGTLGVVNGLKLKAIQRSVAKPDRR